MSVKRLVITADSHTQGEPTRLVIGGIIHYPGRTMQEKQFYISQHYDTLRKSLMGEPRGHRDMFGGFVTAPATEDGDLGIIFMDNEGYLDMCGHGTIGLCTTLVELGLVKVTPPRTEIKIDTPAGRVIGYAALSNGQVTRAGFSNVPAFCLTTKQTLRIDGLCQVEVGIAYGGNFFAIVQAEAFGLDLRPENMNQIRDLGMRIKRAANEQLKVEHPKMRGKNHIDIVTFYGPSNNTRATYQNVHIFSNGQVDRSPGGTGTSAMMAFLIQKGDISLRESVVSQGLAGGLFEGKVVATWEEEGITYHTPEISGVAYVTGVNHFFLDPDDPMLEGVIQRDVKTKPGSALNISAT